jgi:hypothetical protein
MRTLAAVLVSLWFLCGAGNANAGGFILDPSRCPNGNWFPGPPVPQAATDTLCKFLLALDKRDVSAAYALLSADFASRQSPDEFRRQLDELQKREEFTSGGPPERFVINVRSDGGVYVFSIEVFGGSRGYQENVYVSLKQGDAKVVGLRIGPS